MLLLLPLLACTGKPIVGDDTATPPVDETDTDTDADTDTDTDTDTTPLDDADDDGYRASVDCDDTDASVHPGAEEIWYDGVDQDCDGADDDQDGDGYLVAVDCDDTSDAVHPGAGEVPDDGVDQDCDGGDMTSAGTDADGDGYLSTVDCDDANTLIHPGADDVPDDGIDQDCDGADATAGVGDDVDNDGYKLSVDCNDADAAIHPGALDAPGDGIDQDYDGADDVAAPDYDADGDGWVAEAYGGNDCDDTDATVYVGAPETVGDDVDSDCDGADFGIDGLAVGDLVITEIMYDPDAVSDADGEWFEVYNAAGHSVNLLGLEVADDGAYGAADVFTVDEDLVAGVGDRLVFCVNGDATANGGITADYDFAGRGVNLNNSGDDLYLGVDTGAATPTTIDSVTYNELAGWPIAKGVSIELKDTKVDSVSNDTASNWCPATSIAGTTTDKGSPGAASSGC